MTTQEIILQLLEEKGMSKAQLAKKMGMKQPNLSRLLNGNSHLRQSTLDRIKVALGLNVDELKRFQPEEAEDDTLSPFDGVVVGYIDYKGKVVRYNSIKKLKSRIAEIEAEIEKTVNERKKIIDANKKNRAAVSKAAAPDFSTIDIHTRKVIDCSKQRVWSFRKAEDERQEADEVIENRLGNMCKGFDFNVTVDGKDYLFHNSEALYICGAFSDDTPRHISIQKELLANTNGYSAKKKIRRQNEGIKRADWEEFNVEWMKYVILKKVQGCMAFAELLMKIPEEAVIIENSSFQQVNKDNDTSSFWGARNEQLADATKTVEAYINFTHPYETAAVKKRMKMEERNELEYIGKYEGANCMGGILKMAQLYLLHGTPMPIDYDLLNSKQIHLFGHLLHFETPETDVKQMN